MFAISKEFTFSASHQLYGLPGGHKCGRMHGHNYVVVIEVISDVLDETGFVVDYAALDPFGHWLNTKIDHQHLNGVLDFQPSSERLAEYFAGIVRECCPAIPAQACIQVAVSETPKVWAYWRDCS